MEHEQRMRPHVSTTLFALSHLLGIVVTLRFLAFTCGYIAARCQDPALHIPAAVNSSAATSAHKGSNTEKYTCCAVAAKILNDHSTTLHCLEHS
jgi:hypothetical protein